MVAAVTAAGGTISLLVGAVLLRLTLTDTHLRYVRPELGPFLLVAGLAVVGLGLTTLVRALRQGPTEVHGHGDLEHDHEHGVGVGWLLLAPIAALLLVAPPVLGSYGVERSANIAIRSGSGVFEPLDKEHGPVPMTLLEYGQRSFERNGTTLRGATIELTGFAAGEEGDGFRLARYQIACCAADAAPIVVNVVGTFGEPPAVDDWLTVTGTFQPAQGEIPTLAATSITPIPAPEDPYE
jgi:uncharacterized repeat protein (TIGR03943 family)